MAFVLRRYAQYRRSGYLPIDNLIEPLRTYDADCAVAGVRAKPHLGQKLSFSRTVV
jgi:hypothetical protein